MTVKKWTSKLATLALSLSVVGAAAPTLAAEAPESIVIGYALAKPALMPRVLLRRSAPTMKCGSKRLTKPAVSC